MDLPIIQQLQFVDTNKPIDYDYELPKTDNYLPDNKAFESVNNFDKITNVRNTIKVYVNSTVTTDVVEIWTTKTVLAYKKESEWIDKFAHVPLSDSDTSLTDNTSLLTDFRKGYWNDTWKPEFKLVEEKVGNMDRILINTIAGVNYYVYNYNLEYGKVYFVKVYNPDSSVSKRTLRSEKFQRADTKQMQISVSNFENKYAAVKNTIYHYVITGNINDIGVVAESDNYDIEGYSVSKEVSQNTSIALSADMLTNANYLSIMEMMNFSDIKINGIEVTFTSAEKTQYEKSNLLSAIITFTRKSPKYTY